MGIGRPPRQSWPGFSFVDKSADFFSEFAVAVTSFMRGDLHSDRIEMRLVAVSERRNQRFNLVGARHRLNTILQPLVRRPVFSVVPYATTAGIIFR